MNENSVLLIGNGINRAFAKEEFEPQEGNWDFENLSWENIIRQIACNHSKDDRIKEILKLPASMQVIAATGDCVKEDMKQVAESLVKRENPLALSKLCRMILDVPFKHVLTTNYSFELEQAAGVRPGKQACYGIRQHTKQELSKREEKLRLYTYSKLSDKKWVWHIHGDVSTPDSVVMGHYYYGKLLREIQNRVSGLMKVTPGERVKQETSWVDLFLTRDVYVLGFGFYLSEIDLWWLVGCKKRHFPDSHIYFYCPEGSIKSDVRLMMDAYEIKICDHIKLKGKQYSKFYEEALFDIRVHLEQEEKMS